MSQPSSADHAHHSHVTPMGKSCGKAILVGEHAVVYGVPALVAGLDRGAQAWVESAAEDTIFFGSEKVEPTHELYHGLKAIRAHFNVQEVKLRLQLDLPPGCGLGASAALGVAAVRAIANFTGQTQERKIAQAADVWEGVFHGNASGVDAAAARLGGILQFEKGSEPVPLALRAPLRLAVAQAGPPAATRNMVALVAQQQQRNASLFEKNLKAFEALTSNAAACLRGGDMQSLGKLFDLAQMLLAAWLVSSEDIEIACNIARNNGALGAKLTGAGGGGCVIAVGDVENIVQAWQAAGLESFSCEVGTATKECDH